MADATDALLDQWRRERPDLDPWPMGVIGRISRASRALDRELTRFFAAHGLQPGEFDVLATLRRSGEPYELTAGAFLKAAMITSGAVTNRIDRIERKGLVERVPAPDDRRAVRIRLTPNGRAVVDELVGLHVANEERLLAALDTAQRDQLANALRVLLESLGDTSLK